jgi:hypothetical protein
LATTDGCGVGTCCVVETCGGVDRECNTCEENSPTMGVIAVTSINENVQCGSSGNICVGGACTGSK